MRDQSIIERLYQTRTVHVLPLLISILLIMTSLFHLWTGWFGLSDTITHRTIALTLYMLCLFGTKAVESKSNGNRLISMMCFVAALLAGIYAFKTYDAEGLSKKLGALTSWDIVVGSALIVLVLEGIRRSYGLVLVILVSFFIFYTIMP